MTRKTAAHWISLAGVAAFIANFIHVAIGHALYPGYEWMRQAVSDLTAADSPSAPIVSLILCIVGGVRLRMPQFSIMAAATLGSMIVGALGVALVPKDYFGLLERFSEFSAVFFTGCLGLIGFSSRPDASRRPEVPTTSPGPGGAKL